MMTIRLPGSDTFHKVPPAVEQQKLEKREKIVFAPLSRVSLFVPWLRYTGPWFRFERGARVRRCC
jgi:hypothetical protein